MARRHRFPGLRGRLWSAALVAVLVVVGACSSGDSSSSSSSDSNGGETSESSIDAIETTSVASPTLTADGGDGSTTEATTEETTTPEPVDNPVPGCEPGEAVIDALTDPLPAEMEQARLAILDANAACDLDQLVALTDPSALISDPDDGNVLVLNFGDQEPVDFAQLPFDVIPTLLNGPWTMTQADYGDEVADFSNGSHQLHISADGRWTAFLIVVS